MIGETTSATGHKGYAFSRGEWDRHLARYIKLYEIFMIEKDSELQCAEKHVISTRLHHNYKHFTTFLI